MDPREQIEQIYEEEYKDIEFLSSEETLQGISKYLQLQENSREKYHSYKEDSHNREDFIDASNELEIFHEESFKSLIYSFLNNLRRHLFSHDVNQSLNLESSEDIYEYLDMYLRILEEGNGEIWLYAVKKAPKIISLMSSLESYLDFQYHIREIYSQLTSIPENEGKYEDIHQKKRKIIFPNHEKSFGYSTKDIFNEKIFSKYPEIVTEGIINFCRSTEQVAPVGEISEHYLYKNLASKLAFLASISWEEEPQVAESVNKSIDFMISYSKKAIEAGYKSFESGAMCMASLFSEMYKDTLKENKMNFPEIFLKFPNAIMRDMLRVTKDKVKEGEINSQKYPSSLLKIADCMLDKDVDIFGKEIRKYYDSVIKVYYEGDPCQREIAKGELSGSLFWHNKRLYEKRFKELRKQGKKLCKDRNFSKIELLINEYSEAGNIVEILALYSSLFTYQEVNASERLKKSIKKKIKKVFYKISTL